MGLDVFLEDIKRGLLVELIGSMAGMGLSNTSPYAVVSSVDISSFFLMSPIENACKP